MMTLLSQHSKSKNYKSVTHSLRRKNLILKKQLQYSLRTQTTNDCGKSSFKSTFNHHSLQNSPCKQKHILQMPPKPPQIKTDDSNCINLLAIDTVNIALSTTVCHTDSCFTLTGVLSSPLKNSGNILILLILFSLFR